MDISSLARGNERPPAVHRATRQQAVIRQVFVRAARPLCAPEVHALAQQALEGVGAATVYRGIQRLLEEGWLKSVPLPGSMTYYERADLGHHHHFRCEVCERVFDVPGCAKGIERLAPAGFEVRAHELLLVGKCDACGRLGMCER